jgi:hypothetical protein
VRKCFVSSVGLEHSAVNRKVIGSIPIRSVKPAWRNWTARKTSNLKVMGSSPIVGIKVVFPSG